MAAPYEEIRNTNRAFKKLGISKKYSNRSLKNLENLIYDFQNRKFHGYKNTFSKKSNYKFLEQALKYIQKCKDANKAKTKSYYFHNAKRVIYTLISQEEVRKYSFLEFVTIPANIATSIPYINENKLKEKVGKFQAKREAYNLVNKDNKLLSYKQIRNLTPLEIADLDIPKDHPLWFQKQEYEHKDNWKNLENWTNKSTAKHLKIDKYNLKEAKKILFFSKIKNSATSPKIDTKDIYGIKWKLKWGNEVNTETVTNRLYMKLGGRFTDLIYSKNQDTILVLNEKDDKCKSIAKVKTFKRCLLKSKYKFFVDKQISETGKINEANIQALLKDVDMKNIDINSMLGREYIKFHEIALEFKNKKIVKRGGAISVGHLGADKDRAMRGSFILNAWIKNTDPKDNNSKAVLKKISKDNYEYIEFIHDMGSSLGRMREPLDLNSFKTGNRFAFISENKKRGFSGSSHIVFPFLTLYKPRTWNRVTFSDALWMAKKIVKLSIKDIREVVSHTNMPEFIQETLIYKLIKRRNQLAKLFHIEDLLDSKFISKLNIKVHFEDIKYLSDRFRLNQERLQEMVRRHNVSSEFLVKNGKVSSCRKSIIINLLEKTNFPNGLGRRLKRFADDKPLRFCKYKNHFRK